ncbi:hypothetical protein MUK42_07551 [Musa troglodytarum]|uniref:Uncharacterized protein n=1 Tax=Musa troglodytarum TaxID=320322 RepID=A0A9E7KG91_9LILI|nr:hypothetical protein MUK42_07551 [Musa troglodytarum]
MSARHFERDKHQSHTPLHSEDINYCHCDGLSPRAESSPVTQEPGRWPPAVPWRSPAPRAKETRRRRRPSRWLRRGVAAAAAASVCARLPPTKAPSAAGSTALSPPRGCGAPSPCLLPPPPPTPPPPPLLLPSFPIPWRLLRTRMDRSCVISPFCCFQYESSNCSRLESPGLVVLESRIFEVAFPLPGGLISLR